MIEKKLQLLMQVVKTDTYYQSLLQECQELEVEYGRICDGLSQTDKELLDHYISVCENMEYRKLCISLAYWNTNNK